MQRTWTLLVALASVVALLSGANVSIQAAPGGNGGTGGANSPPTAAFTVTCSDLSCDVDGTSSSDAQDADAKLRFDWSFGDGSSATGRTSRHTYSAAGTYTIRLVVTDRGGLTDAEEQGVTVRASGPSNAAPVASFTVSCVDLDCTFDGTPSSDKEDPDSALTVVWHFGDGGGAQTITSSHSYAAGGTYTVELYVRDTGGLDDRALKEVAVEPDAEPDHLPINDDFENAIPILATPFSDRSSDLHADDQPGEPRSCPGEVYEGIYQTLWYTYDATRHGTLVVDAPDLQGQESRIAAYTGPGLRSLSRIACDGMDSLEDIAHIQFKVEPGTRYHLQLGSRSPFSYNLAEVGIDVDLVEAARNDDFADALELTTPTDEVYTQEGATREPGEPTCGGDMSIWFHHTPVRSGQMVVEANRAGGALDFNGAVLCVYTGSALEQLQFLAADIMRVSVPVSAGTRYWIQANNRADDEGRPATFTLVFDVGARPANDELAAAMSIPGLPFTHAGSTRYATREVGEPYGCLGTMTVWYKVTLAAPTTLVLDIAGANLLEVLSSTSDGVVGLRCGTHLTAALGAGDYYVRVGPYQGTPGPYELRVAAGSAGTMLSAGPLVNANMHVRGGLVCRPDIFGCSPDLVLDDPSASPEKAARFEAYLTGIADIGGGSLGGRTVSFYVGSTLVCSAVTLWWGLAACGSGADVDRAIANGGYTARFGGDPQFAAASAESSIVQVRNSGGICAWPFLDC